MNSNESPVEFKLLPVNMLPGFSVKAARLAYASAMFSLLLVAALHFLKRDMAPSWHMVSEYAIGKYGWIMQLAFISWALSCISLVVAIRSQVKTGIGKIGLVLLFIVGLSIIVAGVCVIDAPAAGKEGMTTHGNLHALASLIGMPGHAIAAVLVSAGLVRNPKWQAARKPVLWSAHFTWASLLIMFVTMFIMFAKTKGQFTPETLIGWPNRLVILAYCLWLMVVSKKLLAFDAR